MFLIEYRNSDILLKKNNRDFIYYSADRRIDFNRAEPTLYRTIFLMLVLANKIQLVHS